ELEIASLMDYLMSSQEICFDTETTGVDANDCELVGMSFCIKAQEAFYVPVPADRDQALALLQKFHPLFSDPSKLLIGQNIKYDALVLKWYGIELEGKIFDTMLAHYLLEPDLRHGMDYLAETYLKYQTIHIEELIGKKGKLQGS